MQNYIVVSKNLKRTPLIMTNLDKNWKHWSRNSDSIHCKVRMRSIQECRNWKPRYIELWLNSSRLRRQRNYRLRKIDFFIRSDNWRWAWIKSRLISQGLNRELKELQKQSLEKQEDMGAREKRLRLTERNVHDSLRERKKVLPVTVSWFQPWL